MTEPIQTPAIHGSPVIGEAYLSRTELSEYLAQHGFKVSAKTLAKMATLGGGPEYQRFGNRALYLPSVGIKWAMARLSQPRASTSEAGCA